MKRTLPWCLMLALISGTCDRLRIVDFEIVNQHDKDIRIEFTDYNEGWRGDKDSVFTIAPGASMIVYVDDGLALPKDVYIHSGKLAFCSEVKLLSNDVKSGRDLLLEDEWTHRKIDNYSDSYTSIIKTEDFN